MRNRVDLNCEWRRAVRQAILDLKAEGADSAAETVLVVLDTTCPLSLDDVNRDPSDPAGLVERLTQVLPLGDA